MADTGGVHERRDSIALGTITHRQLPPVRNGSDQEDLVTEEPRLDEVQNIVSREDIPPDGGYGWICTASVFLINAHTWGVNAAWAIFLAQYLDHATFPGATMLEYALIGGLTLSQAMLSSPVVNICIRRFGTRTTLIIGAFLEFLALFAASYATKIWHLMLSQGIVFGWGMGLLYITATATLPQWFSAKRSLAVGIASSGAGIGGLVYNLVAGKAVQSIGLSWTYKILAFCALAANMVSAFLLKDRNTAVKPSQMALNYRELGRIEVILVVVWGFLTELGYIVLLYSLPSYANAIGLTHNQGAVVGGLLNLGLALSRPIVGYLSDRVGRINMAMAMTALCGMLCLAVWVPAHTYGVLLTFAVSVGFVCGTFWGTSISVTAEVVGLKRLPSVFNLICIALVLPSVFAEPIGLQIVTDSGYLGSQVFVGIMFIGGAISTWCLRCWRINEIEKKGLAESGDARAMVGRGFWLTPRTLFLKKRV